MNSRVEPFGLVILEAMACNTPVIAASVDGIPEIIKHNENGWLVPAQDEGELVEAILDLGRREDLRARLAHRAKQDVAARFSVERYVSQLQKFYYARTNFKSSSINGRRLADAEAASSSLECLSINRNGRSIHLTSVFGIGPWRR